MAASAASAPRPQNQLLPQPRQQPQGTALQDTSAQAVPLQALTPQATPAQGMPAQGMPAQATPTQAMPAQAIPVQAAPAQPMPSQTMVQPDVLIRGETLRILRLDARLTALSARASNDRALRTLLCVAPRNNLEPALARFHALRQRDTASPRAEPQTAPGDTRALRAARRAVKVELRLADHVASLHAATSNLPPVPTQESSPDPDLTFRMRDLEARSRDHRLLHLVAVRAALAALSLDLRPSHPCLYIGAQVDGLRARAHLLWTEPSPREVDMDLPHPTRPRQPSQRHQVQSWAHPDRRAIDHDQRLEATTPRGHGDPLFHHDSHSRQANSSIRDGSSRRDSTIPRSLIVQNPAPGNDERDPDFDHDHPDNHSRDPYPEDILLDPRDAARELLRNRAVNMQSRYRDPSPPFSRSRSPSRSRTPPPLAVRRRPSVPVVETSDSDPSHPRELSREPSLPREVETNSKSQHRPRSRSRSRSRSNSAHTGSQHKPASPLIHAPPGDLHPLDDGEAGDADDENEKGTPHQDLHARIKVYNDRRESEVSSDPRISEHGKSEEFRHRSDSRDEADQDDDETDDGIHNNPYNRTSDYEQIDGLRQQEGEDSLAERRNLPNISDSHHEGSDDYNQVEEYSKNMGEGTAQFQTKDLPPSHREKRRQSGIAALDPLHKRNEPDHINASARRATFNAATQTPSLPPDLIPVVNPFDSPPRLPSRTPATSRKPLSAAAAAAAAATAARSSSGPIDSALMVPEIGQTSLSMAPPPQITTGNERVTHATTNGNRRKHIKSKPAPYVTPHGSGATGVHMGGISHQLPEHGGPSGLQSHHDLLIPTYAPASFPPYGSSDAYLSELPSQRQLHAPPIANLPGEGIPQSASAYALGYGPQAAAGAVAGMALRPHSADGLYPGATGPLPAGRAPPSSAPPPAAAPTGELPPGVAPPGQPVPNGQATETPGESGEVPGKKNLISRIGGMLGAGKSDGKEEDEGDDKGVVQLAQHALGFALQHAPGEGKRSAAVHKIGKLVTGNDSDSDGGRGGAELAQQAMGFVLQNAGAVGAVKGGKNAAALQKFGKVVSGDDDAGFATQMAHQAVRYAMKRAPAEAGKALVANQLGNIGKKALGGGGGGSGGAAAGMATQAIGQLLGGGSSSKRDGGGAGGMVAQLGEMLGGDDNNRMLGTVMNTLGAAAGAGGSGGKKKKKK